MKTLCVTLFVFVCSLGLRYAFRPTGPQMTPVALGSWFLATIQFPVRATQQTICGLLYGFVGVKALLIFVFA